MDDYFKGKKLYGDDFSTEQIRKWYEEEAEGYAGILNEPSIDGWYANHEMNKIYGYNKIRFANINNVLGLGSACGNEFLPIISRIYNLTIIEPSDKFISSKIGHLVPTYIKPNLDGSLVFNDESFDLITCFGVLHHICNVTFVLKEIIRVLRPDGYLLLREPITSMGDWNYPRKGGTKNERGIPVNFFENFFNGEAVEIISREFCSTAISLYHKTIDRLLKHPFLFHKVGVLIDKIISLFLKGNVHYHARNKIGKIAPGSIYYVIRKTEINKF